MLNRRRMEQDLQRLCAAGDGRVTICLVMLALTFAFLTLAFAFLPLGVLGFSAHITDRSESK